MVTAHNRPIPVLDEFAARVSGSGDTGSLDGPSFLAALLEWVLGAYTAAFERIEQRLEEFDVHAKRGEGAVPGRRGVRAAHARARRAASSNGVRSSGSSFRIRSSRAIVGLRSPSTSGRATDALTGVTRLSQSEER